MLGDLIWDYFDQKGIIKKSADQWLLYYDTFNLGNKSDSESFLQIIEDENIFFISQILQSYYLMAYVAKSKNNKQLSFQSVWQKESNFIRDIVIYHKDIRDVFNTEYKIILNAVTKMGSDSAKLAVDEMHNIIVRTHNNKDESCFKEVAMGIDVDLRMIDKLCDVNMSESIDDALKDRIDEHEWKP